MQTLAANPSLIGGIIGGWEIALILAVVLIFLGAKNLPGIGPGAKEGIFQFRKNLGNLQKELDQEAHDAGESLGGIYEKPAAQALSSDNKTAELYDPAAFHNQDRPTITLFRALTRLWRLIRNVFARSR